MIAKEIHAGLKAMIDAREGAAAAAHLETFIAACFEKAEEIDDSSGGLGQQLLTSSVRGCAHQVPDRRFRS